MTQPGQLEQPPGPADRWASLGIAFALLGLRIAGFVLLAGLIVSTALVVIWIR